MSFPNSVSQSIAEAAEKHGAEILKTIDRKAIDEAREDNRPDLLKRVFAAAEKNCTSVEKVIDEAEEIFRKLPEFDEWVSKMVHKAISDHVYEEVHQVNTRLQKKLGFYGLPPKVVVTDSPAVREVLQAAWEKNHREQKHPPKK